MFITPVFNGMPWVTFHYPQFRRLKHKWQWHVIDGKTVAEHGHMDGDFSCDGTDQYFESIKWDSRVKYWNSGMLNGMTDAMNIPMHLLTEETLVWKLDHDEVWDCVDLEKVVALFEKHPEKNMAMFWCRYLVGNDIEVTSRHTWGNQSGEWPRVWRLHSGDTWYAETPPLINGFKPNMFTQDEMESAGVVFKHYAYVTPKQAKDKNRRYKDQQHLEGWNRLQKHKDFPTSLKEFFKWVPVETTVSKVHDNPF